MQFALVAQQHFLDIGGGVLLDIPDPVLDVFKGLLLGYVIDQHDAHGASVIGRCDCSKTLLAGSVPE